MSEWKLREQMCEIGRRVYAKGFAAANDGNISYRLSEDRSPLHADDGVQGLHEARRHLHGRHRRQAGRRQAQAVQRDPAAPGDHEEAARRQGVRPLPPAPRDRLRRRPRADPQVRAARGRGLPRRGADRARTRRPAARSSPTRSCRTSRTRNTIILANHGTITFGSDLENAYFKTEIIDAYCRILILAKQIGRVQYYNDAKAAELIKLKPGLGVRDVRLEKGLENCDLCGNSLFREGYTDFKPEPRASSRRSSSRSSISCRGEFGLRPGEEWRQRRSTRPEDHRSSDEGNEWQGDSRQPRSNVDETLPRGGSAVGRPRFRGSCRRSDPSSSGTNGRRRRRRRIRTISATPLPNTSGRSPA